MPPAAPWGHGFLRDQETLAALKTKEHKFGGLMWQRRTGPSISPAASIVESKHIT
jgi:hypothetical protein